MKNMPKIAIISTSKESFLRYCALNGLSNDTAKLVRIKSDIVGEEFSEKISIDEKVNVTDYVIDNIMICGEDNSAKREKLR